MLSTQKKKKKKRNGVVSMGGNVGGGEFSDKRSRYAVQLTLGVLKEKNFSLVLIPERGEVLN